MKAGINTKTMCITALATALVCLSTMVIHIPIPMGYAHLGDGCILLISLMFGWKIGMFAGGVGSAMADFLTGFPQWVLPTLVIKCMMGCIIAWIGYDKQKFHVSGLRPGLAAVAGLVEMMAGYVVAGAVMAGSVPAGISQLPGLALKSLVNLGVFYALGYGVYKTRMVKRAYESQ